LELKPTHQKTFIFSSGLFIELLIFYVIFSKL